MADDLNDQLGKLQPKARARVQDALKASIERELAANTDIAGMEAGAHSRGILFSRATAAIRDIDQVIINQAAQLDDAQFESFVGRLKQLRGGEQG